MGQLKVRENIFKLWLHNHWMLWLAIEMYRNHWVMDNHKHKSYYHAKFNEDIQVYETALETTLISTPYGVHLLQLYTPNQGRVISQWHSESQFSGDEVHRQLLVFAIHTCAYTHDCVLTHMQHVFCAQARQCFNYNIAFTAMFNI